MARINSLALASTNGSPLINYQWSKTHCGKAFPWVFPLNIPVKPKDSETGKYDLT